MTVNYLWPSRLAPASVTTTPPPCSARAAWARSGQATDTQLNRQVALKIRLARFTREAIGNSG